MVRYITLRVFGLVPVLFFISLIVFLVVALIPGNAAMVIAGEQATAEEIELAAKRLGLDKPVHLRYVWWLGRVLQGNLGESLLNKQAVTTVIGQALPVTIELTLLGLAFGTIVAFPIGIIAALKQGFLVDKVLIGVLLIAISVPAFWSALMLILLFAVQVQLFPASGYTPLLEDPLGNLERMALPTLSVGAFQAGVLARFVRSGMLEVLGQDYIRTARAKGLKSKQVILAHALKNMLIPIITFMGLQLGGLLGGLVITEEIFALPGIGRLVLNAIFNRDFPVVQGVVLFVAVVYVVINLLVDILYAFLDPRIRYAGTD